MRTSGEALILDDAIEQRGNVVSKRSCKQMRFFQESFDRVGQVVHVVALGKLGSECKSLPPLLGCKGLFDQRDHPLQPAWNTPYTFGNGRKQCHGNGREAELSQELNRFVS